jgi:DNA-binding FadR family transcriptional regulator
MGGKRLFQSVAAEIAGLIDDGAFPSGTRLPGERELAERFGVSRVTIREAEIALQAVGRLEIKTGSGVYVSENSSVITGSLPSASAFEVTEARLLIESEAAALAAQNISDEELSLLAELVESMRTGDEDAANEADRAFHSTIAEASHNAAMIHTVKTLWRMRVDLPEVKATYAAVCVHDVDTRAAEHLAVYEALKARDSVGARAAMRDHFHRLIESMLDATEKMALEEVQEKASKSRARFAASAKIG